MRKLYLQINHAGAKMMQMRDRNKVFYPIKMAILKRDNNTCQFCAFNGIEPQMKIVALDGNYNNNNPKNLLTACSICTRCLLIGSFEATGEHDSVERLIICNELSQVQLNHLYRVLLCSMSDATLDHCETAKTVFRSLRNRSILVDEIFGKDASDTRVFMQSVLDSEVSTHKNLRGILDNLRYFPSRNSFHNEWSLWRKQLAQSANIKLKIRL